MNESESLFDLLGLICDMVGYRPDINNQTMRVRFTNGVPCSEDLFLIGINDGPIATKDEYENSKCSFAHLMPNGRVMQHGEQIATRDDLLIWNPIQLHE